MSSNSESPSEEEEEDEFEGMLEDENEVDIQYL